jgi:hypothetical protein
LEALEFQEAKMKPILGTKEPISGSIIGKGSNFMNQKRRE